MEGVPEKCSVCSTPIHSGARCLACGAVYGEDNRCPHCRALAGVRYAAQSRGYRCVSCNGARERKPGTTVFGKDPEASGIPGDGGSATSAPMRAPVPATSTPAAVTAQRGASTASRIFGATLLACGVLAGAASAIFVPGIGGVALAAALGGVLGGAGIFAMRAGAKGNADADAKVDTQRELALLDIAERHHGVLTVTDAARGLGISMEEADALLTRLADGSRVLAEITVDGRVEYVFREIRMRALEKGDAPKVRVEEEVYQAAQERLREEAEEEAEPATPPREMER